MKRRMIGAWMALMITASSLVVSASPAADMSSVSADPQQEQPQMERISEEQNNAAVQSGSQARSASSQPKTGDNTKSEFFILMMLAAGLTMLGAFWLHRKYRDIHEKDH